MEMKNLPVRLEPGLYQRLKEIAEFRSTSMVEIVREALEAFLPTLAREEARELEERAERLRALAEADPEYIERAIARVARAEAEHADPLEEDLVVERRDQGAPNGQEGDGPVTARVKDVLTELG